MAQLSSCRSCFVAKGRNACRWKSFEGKNTRNIRAGVMKLLRQIHRIHVTMGVDLKTCKPPPPGPQRSEVSVFNVRVKGAVCIVFLIKTVLVGQNVCVY